VIFVMVARKERRGAACHCWLASWWRSVSFSMFVSVSVIGSSRTLANTLASSGTEIAEAGGHIMAFVRRPPAVRGHLQFTDTDEVFVTRSLDAEAEQACRAMYSNLQSPAGPVRRTSDSRVTLDGRILGTHRTKRRSVLGGLTQRIRGRVSNLQTCR
jgi:hypothetical protein